MVSAKAGDSDAAGSSSKRPRVKEAIPIAEAHDTSLTNQILELQLHYEKDMRVMMDSYKGLHAKYTQALALLNRMDEGDKGLALDILGVGGKWVSQPPPFDPGSRPFVDRPEPKANKSGSVRKSGPMATNMEQRPRPPEFAVARKFEPEEYTEDELRKLDRDLFKPVPKP